MKKIINSISVKNLINFTFLSGNLENKFSSSKRMVEGTRLHRKLLFQISEIKGCSVEVPLEYIIKFKEYTFRIRGFADSISVSDDEVIINEIKTTNMKLDEIEEVDNENYWAQVKCYAFLYTKKNDIDDVFIQLTYCSLKDEKVKQFKIKISSTELQEYFNILFEKYYYWFKFSNDLREERDISISNLEFPFKDYRRGQDELISSVFDTIIEEKNLYIRAPTGIGKTIGTIFPSLQALGQGFSEKVFYLTAKTITRQIAQETLLLMIERGLKVKSVTITARSKICFLGLKNCETEHCEFAKGYFDRLSKATEDVLQNEYLISRGVIENYAQKHKICPFEFSLDLSNWCDFIICDYNYLFDPKVYLRRFFLYGQHDYIFLIDEAHNLIDRARDMYSSEIYKSPFLKIKRKIKNEKISKIANRLNSYMLDIKKKCDNRGFFAQREIFKEILLLLRIFVEEAEKWLLINYGREGYQELLEQFYNSISFLKIAEFYNDNYVSYIKKEKNEVILKIFCLDPSSSINQVLQKGRSSVFFSATLEPLKYYQDLLGGVEEDNLIELISPFPEENLNIVVAGYISTKYRHREQSYENIADIIRSVVEYKIGNYMVYFSSYEYMKKVVEIFSEKSFQFDILIQSPYMTEYEREEFLNKFKSDNKDILIGFAVLGGIFSESIDLKGDRLIGSIVVGVGLPKICNEREIIREYFQNINGFGYEYAYMIPGMNKVLQASGRVIRTEYDKGVIVLIDNRFLNSKYRSIYPAEWNSISIAMEKADIEKYLERFWL